MNKIGLAIRYYREQHKLTQKELGIKTNIDPNAISHYETGKRQPSVDILINIAEKLDIQVEKLLNPEDVIWRRECVEKIIQEMDFLTKDEHFIRIIESTCGRALIFTFKSADDPNSNYYIHIGKKLGYIHSDCWLKRPNLHPIILGIFDCPEWFQDLTIQAESKFLEMIFKEGIKIKIPFLIKHSVLKQKIGFTWANIEYEEIMYRYKHHGVLHSKEYNGIIDEIVSTMQHFQMNEEIRKIEVLKHVN